MKRTTKPPNSKHYTFAERNTAGNLFQKYFGIGLGSFYDGLISVIEKRICIDIVKFDQYLQIKFKATYTQNESMQDFILKQYGIEAVNFFKGLL